MPVLASIDQHAALAEEMLPSKKSFFDRLGIALVLGVILIAMLRGRS